MCAESLISLEKKQTNKKKKKKDLSFQTMNSV